MLNDTRCECEHATHHERCPNDQAYTIRTLWGTYRLCVGCFLSFHMVTPTEVPNA